MRFSEAAGRKVVSTSTASTVGKIEEFVIDPRTHAIVALTLKKTDGARTLRWADIAAFGADAITVSAVEQLSEASPEITRLSGKDSRLLGKRVLATSGDELGKLDDVEFDPETGVITELILADAATTDAQLAGTRLVGVGSYAVVVQAG